MLTPTWTSSTKRSGANLEPASLRSFHISNPCFGPAGLDCYQLLPPPLPEEPPEEELPLLPKEEGAELTTIHFSYIHTTDRKVQFVHFCFFSFTFFSLSFRNTKVLISIIFLIILFSCLRLSVPSRSPFFCRVQGPFVPLVICDPLTDQSVYVFVYPL